MVLLQLDARFNLYYITFVRSQPGRAYFFSCTTSTAVGTVSLNSQVSV